MCQFCRILKENVAVVTCGFSTRASESDSEFFSSRDTGTRASEFERDH